MVGGRKQSERGEAGGGGFVERVRFKNNRPDLAVTVIKAVNGGNRTAVSQPVFSAGDTESGDAAFVIENVESLGAGFRRETGDDIDVSGATDFHLEAVLERAAFDEVFVDLRFVEAVDDGPDGFGSGGFVGCLVVAAVISYHYLLLWSFDFFLFIVESCCCNHWWWFKVLLDSTT
ncbi:unnamed protein product [Vicia faba]|uniref:Uncharacterized protein n=1 Tax=Vicia faba TaxID=3906 RepID=A0AAV1AG64_VICFA|nr:unnamed protein product [Vicia faba]